MFTPLLLVLLFQGDPVRSLDAHTMVSSAQIRSFDEQRRRSIAEGQREFEVKFNKLIDALEEFSKEYRSSQGQVWPAKKAEALKTALREVERSMPTYRKPSGQNGPADATSVSAVSGDAVDSKSAGAGK
jgi:hypothetical protein